MYIDKVSIFNEEELERMTREELKDELDSTLRAQKRINEYQYRIIRVLAYKSEDKQSLRRSLWVNSA